MVISDYIKNGSSKYSFFGFQMLYEISRNLNHSIKLDNLFAQSIVVLKKAFQIDDICIMLLDNEAKELKDVAIDTIVNDPARGIAVKIGEGISILVAYTGEPVLIQDVRNDNRLMFYHDTAGSLLSVPLKLDNGEITGVLNIYKKDTNAFQKDDVALFRTIASDISHTIERIKLYENAMKQSIHDDLTTLYTKKYFLENCHQEYNKTSRKDEAFSLILIDIDHFKYFNDTYGHSVGDKVIQTVARIIKAHVRQGDVVSRYGGEEFAVLLPETGRDGATVVAEKIRAMVQGSSLEVGIDKFEKVTITAGVASYPEDGATVNIVVDKADKLLLLGKENGRNMVVDREKSDRALIKDEEKRLLKRCRAGLKVAECVDFPQYIEINFNGSGWKLCNVVDISKMGLNGLSDYEVKAGSIHECRVVFNVLDKAHCVFQMKVVYVMEMNSNRYRFGAKIIDDLKIWQKLFTFLSR